MNQILMTENKKKKEKKSSGPIEIKGIVRFFAFVILIFGLTLIGEGSYAIYKEAEENDPTTMPILTIGRLNDTAVIYVEHTVEISTITYSWNNGEETVLPEGGLTAQETILLPNQNSVLNITVEDMNGKRGNYQKQYNIEGMDITKPVIDVEVEDGNKKMTITATDDTEIAYLSYQWENEEPVIIEPTEEGQFKITEELDLTPGTRKINIIAEDINGNIEKIEKEIVATTSEPTMQLIQNASQIIIEASDEDGLAEIKLNLNGKQYVNKLNGEKNIQLGPVALQEGNNTILVEVTNVSGYTKKASTELQYTP